MNQNGESRCARSRGDLWITVPFLLMISVPCLGLFFPGFSGPNLNEKRQPAPIPYSLGAFSATGRTVEERARIFFTNASILPGQVKAYVKDHFGFRSRLIDTAGKLNLLKHLN